MKQFHSTRARIGGVALAAITVAGLGVGVAIAGSKGETKKENWSQIDRNTIGSPVAALRDGPSSLFPTGQLTAPPYGKGSLGIEVADEAVAGSDKREKATFGNQVDFFGDNVLDLTAVGFHVFNTGENTAGNMPNITLEIDANLNALPADNYTSMVWVPGPSPVVDQWSPFIDATTSGTWGFTGAEGGATGCTNGGTCTFAQAMAALNDGGDTPIIYTLAIGKGRDSKWSGAVDGLRINDKIYDFEEDGVKHKSAK